MGEQTHPGNLFTEGISHTCTPVGKFPGKFPMEATSNTCSGVPVQVFWRKCDCCDIVEAIPREFVHRGRVGVWAKGGDGEMGVGMGKCWAIVSNLEFWGFSKKTVFSIFLN